MLKQEKRRSAEAEAALKNAGSGLKRLPSPILGRVSPLQLADTGTHDVKRPATETGHKLHSSSPEGVSVSTSGSVLRDGRGSAERDGDVHMQPSKMSGRATAALKAGETCIHKAACIFISICKGKQVCIYV